jgi:signal transduction histidine kinase/ligand-binding sensor domain-containing protein
LNRLDRESGSFTRFRADQRDPQSLSSDQVWTIYQDRAGRLWVGTDAALDRFEPEGGTFTHYQPHTLPFKNSVRALYEDGVGALWVGTTGGLSRFDRQAETFTSYANDPRASRSLSADVITAIYEDRAGVLWIGTNGGLNRFNRITETFARYRNDPHDPRSLGDDSVTAILEDRSGVLWVGTHGGGLDSMDRGTGRFVHNRHDPGNPYSLSDDDVLAVYEDQEGGLWVGTAAGGAGRSNARQRQIIHYRNVPGDPNSLSDNHVRAIHAAPSGDLWIGTTDGLNRLDRETGEYTHYRHDPADPGSLRSDVVLSIHQDRAGMLWIGTLQGGLDRFDPQTGRSVNYQYRARDPMSPSHNTVRVIHEDRSGALWIGTANGLDRLDPATGLFDRYTYRVKLTNDDIHAIHEDRAGILWIGTAAGLNALDREKNEVTQFAGEPCDAGGLCGGLVLSIHEDLAGHLWVGTFQGGLSKLDRETGRFIHYRTPDGLPSDAIYGMLEDEQGNLWLSTNQGLSRFDPQRERFANYGVHDGLQGDEFSGGAYHRSPDGEMFFGGINGLNAFYPEQLRQDPLIPPIVLTSFTQSGEEVPLTDAAVTLRWPNNFFDFEFAALSYDRPAGNQHAYMLEGFDQDWIETGSRRFGKYTNLPGRTYTLRLKGSNSDGIWNDKGLAIEVTVVPPFWTTWWFQGALALILVAGVFGGYRLRVRSIETRSRDLERQVVERTAELQRESDQRLRAEEALRQSEMEKAVAAERSRLARELHDAVTQTLFSASLIAEALPETWERDREEGRQLLRELRQSNRGVLAEMRTLLLELRPASLLEADLGDLLRQLGEAVATREDLSVDVVVEGPCVLPADVHVALYRIAQEALNNVVKHARADRVEIFLRCTARPPQGSDTGITSLELRVTDDGRGFDPSHVSPEHLGLGIMRERAESVGATFTVESQPGHGTTVAVFWPAGA